MNTLNSHKYIKKDSYFLNLISINFRFLTESKLYQAEESITRTTQNHEKKKNMVKVY
jgi:hypothetical protein